ncbi:Hypothetical protein, predicted hydrolase of the HAD family [Mycoplasma yeatsii 13926]|uniref:Hydrolase of the HAD family n=1 Tax=Mycoplasma yeatsii 13926 TaxID=1188240 RepID=S6G3E8_9MOLU|nr:HAD-IIB family hydrolase [Mycoplasma yeatsii]EOA07076.1 Hypothetical protein, predicted hydrolase of the HAD family [Mycoplasma yeatsii 13926]
MKDVKLLILDMDGTSYKKMGPIIKENVEPLKEAIKNNVEVVFVTGRPVNSKQNSLVEHGFTSNHSFIAGYNGACIYDLVTNEILASNPIDWATAKKVYDLAASERFKKDDIKIWGYSTDLKTSILNKWTKDPVDYGYEGNLFEGEIVELKDINQEHDFFKLLAFNANKEFFDILKDELKLNVSTNDYRVIEINKQNVNKKFAVDWFSDHFNIGLENIAAMGDGMNDYDMIEYVGIGVALKNSVQAIKNIAQVYIDKTSEEAAVKEFVEQYILNRKN